MFGFEVRLRRRQLRVGTGDAQHETAGRQDAEPARTADGAGVPRPFHGRPAPADAH